MRVEYTEENRVECTEMITDVERMVEDMMVKRV